MPFIGLRVLYGFLTFFIKSSSFSNSLAWKIVLQVIPELVVVAIFTLVGVLTRNMYKERRSVAKLEAFPQMQQQRPPYLSQQQYPAPGQAY